MYILKIWVDFLCFHVYTDDSIPSLSITVNSQLQSGGLGSSAAFSVALSAVLLTDSGLITLGQDQNDFNSLLACVSCCTCDGGSELWNDFSPVCEQSETWHEK